MKNICVLPAFAFLLVFFVIPVVLLLSYSFLDRDYLGDVYYRLSSDAWYHSVDSVSLKVIRRTVIVSVSVTILCLLIGYPVACIANSFRKVTSELLLGIFVFPLITSSLLKTYGWIGVLPSSWKGNIFVVVFVMTSTYLPFMILSIIKSLERIDINLIDASMDLGANKYHTLVFVTLPLSLNGILSGCLLVFIPSAGEYLVPHFIGEGKVNVVATLILQQFMERRNWPYAASMTVWLITILLIPFAVINIAIHVWSKNKTSEE
jgi:spermidine/putrescine transport system permease protein